VRRFIVFISLLMLAVTSYAQSNPTTITINGTTYNQCATEGNNCTLTAANNVVFGAFNSDGTNDGYVIQHFAAGTVWCDDGPGGFSGTDPAYGYSKACWQQAGTAPPPPTVTVTANPTSITSGQSSTLSWSSTNATSCSGIGSSTSTSGSQSETPTTTTTYTETCSGTGGTGSGSATVTVSGSNPPPTVTLSASPTTIASGGSSTLSLTTSNATSCSGPISGTSGTTSVSPSSTTTYTETCTGPGGSGSGSATVTVTGGGSCQASNQQAAPSGSDLIDADVQNSDGLRVYPAGTTPTFLITTRATSADTLNWVVEDSLGHSVKSGSFSVPASPVTTSVSCAMPSQGYFLLTATLTHGGGSVGALGTRPAGGAAFGILPSTGLPAPVYSAPDQHRFAMQGFNHNHAALVDLGVRFTIDDREQSWGEPNGPNTYTVSNDLGPDYTAHTDIMRLIRLDGIPGWDSSNGMFNDSYSLPTNLTEYGQYMAKIGTDSINILGQYYPNQRHDYYQVTWEPSLGWPQTGGSNASNFLTLYQTVYQALHSTDSKALVMGPAEPFANNNNNASGNRITNTPGLCNYLDGVTTHGYYNAPTTPSNPPELQNQQSGAEANSLNNEMSGLRATMQACKPNMVLWSTELGISYDSGVSYTGASPNQLWAQAVVAARSHIIILGEGAQLTTYFFGPDFPDSLAGYGTFYDLDDPQGNAGATDLQPKPEAMALSALSAILDGTSTLGKLNGLPATAYGYAFQQLGGGKVITALWAHDNGHWPDSTGAYSSTYCVPYTLTVDGSGTSGTVVILDAYGNPSSVPYSNGQLLVNLTESPIYVVSANATVAKAHVTAPVGYTGQ
jgi:hypothetical protein